MAEYIEREALLEKRWDVPFETEDSHFVQVVDVGDIIAAPTADVEPVRHGNWKYYKKQGIAVCTECSFERKLDDNFGRAVSCPNCGAKMV